MSDTNKAIVEKINQSFSENKPEDFLSYCAEDVSWVFEGAEAYAGKDAIREFMDPGKDAEPPKFTVTKLFGDGDTVACYGEMTMTSEGKDEIHSYCDVYTFEAGKVTELRSFIVRHKSDGEKDQAASA